MQELLGELHNQKIEEANVRKPAARSTPASSTISMGPSPPSPAIVQLMNQRIGNSTRLESGDLEFIKSA